MRLEKAGVNTQDRMKHMAITRKLRQKVRDGSVREMWQEMK